MVVLCCVCVHSACQPTSSHSVGSVVFVKHETPTKQPPLSPTLVCATTHPITPCAFVALLVCFVVALVHLKGVGTTHLCHTVVCVSSVVVWPCLTTLCLAAVCQHLCGNHLTKPLVLCVCHGWCSSLQPSTTTPTNHQCGVTHTWWWWWSCFTCTMCGAPGGHTNTTVTPSSQTAGHSVWWCCTPCLAWPFNKPVLVTQLCCWLSTGGDACVVPSTPPLF